MLAIVLSRHDFKENDQIISLYTLDRGKVEALAKGVKKIGSKNTAILEPFSFLEAELVRGREPSRLIKAVPANYFARVRSDFKKSLLAGYAMDLADRILQPGLPDKNIFFLLADWLEFLDGAETAESVLMDALVARFFILLGFDIRQVKTLPDKIKENLEFLTTNSWTAVKKTEPLSHRLIHKFAVYHAEKPLADWAKICQL